MPKKKVSKKTTKTVLRREDVLSNADSYKSLFYGIATVIVLFILGFSAVKIFISRPKPEIDHEAVSVSKIEEAMKETKDNTYTVQPGESLWSIAEAKYNDGYKWTEIASANNIEIPYDVEPGQKLILPVAMVSPTPEPTVVLEISPNQNPDNLNIKEEDQDATVQEDTQSQIQQEKLDANSPTQTDKEEIVIEQDVQPSDQKITGKTYKIAHGDDLWEIAVRAYGDGYRWVDIASANKLENPDIIHSDNVLTIPR